MTSICEVFEAQVVAFPDAPALLFGNESLSYRDLNERANQLAHHLRRCGVTRGVPVGMLMEPSTEAVIATLAVLKAGGAYVPLDTNNPPMRLKCLLDDAQIRIVVTEQHLGETLPATEIKLIYLDANGRAIADESTENTVVETSGDDLAYIMFTSGSTGIPKGVCIPHRGVVRLVKDVDYVSLSRDEVLLQSAPITFDAATFEIWGALLNGARLAIPPRRFDLKDLGIVIRKYKVTTIWLTARLFDTVVDNSIDDLRPLRQILFGGEQASMPHVKKAFRELNGCRLINGYGPTENTTFTCTYEVTGADLDKDMIPIGRPISKTQVYILDDNLKPVSDGQEGELYIAGEGLALGYLNRPELTAEKFQPNPFAGGELLYRSGDRVHCRADGNIEFLGRRDSQVKIRGFRIELGEIEAQLLKYPGILQVVVRAMEPRSGKKFLVAYYRPDPAKELHKSEIMGFLADRLPGYMVPAHLIAMPEFPLNINGKLDVSRFPVPFSGGGEDRKPAPQPRDQAEEKLRAIWRKAVGNNKIGVHDNFFEYGGDSLSALEISIEIERQMGKSIPLSSLFQFPTVKALSGYLKQKANAGKMRHSLVPIQTSGSNAPLFCVPWKGGTSITFRALAHRLGPEQPVYGLEPIDENGEDINFKSIPEIAAFFTENILSVQPSGPYYLCGASRGGIVAWEVASQLEARNKEVALIGLFDSPEPTFHVGTKPFRKTFRRKAAFFFRYVSLFYTGCKIILQKGHMEDLHEFSIFTINWGSKRLLRIFNRIKHKPNNDLKQYAYVPYVKEQLLEGYRPKPCRARTVLFRSRYDYFEGWDKDIYLGWKPHALSGIAIKHIPGQHGGLLREPFVWILAEQLKPYLGRQNSIIQQSNSPFRAIPRGQA